MQKSKESLLDFRKQKPGEKSSGFLHYLGKNMVQYEVDGNVRIETEKEGL